MSKYLEKLDECNEQLKKVFLKVSETWEIQILQGFRNEEDQRKAYESGHSKLDWPFSKHNSQPSQAVDVMPLPVDFNDTVRLYLFAGFCLGIAESLGIELRWGGDWAGLHDPKKNKFNDLVHFELKS